MATVAYNYSTHIAILVSPCISFTKLAKDTKNEAIAASVISCKQIFEDKMTNLIKSNCKNVKKINALDRQNHHQQRRHRRFFPLVGAGAIGGIVSYGVLSIKHYFENRVESSASKMDEQITQQIRLIKNNNEQLEKWQEEMIQVMNKTWTQLNMMEKMSEENVRASRIFTLVINSIEKMHTHLQYLFHDFHLEKVSNNYAILFPDSPFLNGTPIKYWSSHKCEIMGEDTFIMKFEIPVGHHDVKILRVDPFMIFTKSSKGQECLKAFKGNKYVIWDLQSNCTRDLLGEPMKENDIILVNEDRSLCVEHLNRTKNWENVYCDDQLEKHQYIQTKQDGSQFYVYCYLHSLSVQDMKPVICNNTVYHFSRQKSFSIDGHQWKVTSNNYESKYDVNSRISELINQRTFYPSIGINRELKDLTNLLREQEKITAQIDWKAIAIHPIAYGSGSGIIGLLILFLIVKHLLQKSASRNVIQRYEEAMVMRNLIQDRRPRSPN